MDAESIRRERRRRIGEEEGKMTLRQEKDDAVRIKETVR